MEADADFEVWRTYFQIALEGSASTASLAKSVVKQADAIATLAAELQRRRRATTVRVGP
jgi:hypothetical protein